MKNSFLVLFVSLATTLFAGATAHAMIERLYTGEQAQAYFEAATKKDAPTPSTKCPNVLVAWKTVKPIGIQDRIFNFFHPTYTGARVGPARAYGRAWTRCTKTPTASGDQYACVVDLGDYANFTRSEHAQRAFEARPEVQAVLKCMIY